MRIWSIHPKYLDSKGLVALWREALLARHVLEGKTKGYRHHPQLLRFRNCRFPVDAIHFYLHEVYREALKRKYRFDPSLFQTGYRKTSISVTEGQMNYEKKHLMAKLKLRDPGKYSELQKKAAFIPHPLFTLVKGDIEEFEVLPEKKRIKKHL